MDSFDEFSCSDFSIGNHLLYYFAACKVPDQSHFRCTQQKTSRKRLGTGMKGQEIWSNHKLAVRKLRQLLGEEVDPVWTVMDMDMVSSMLLLLDHSFTFKDVAQFSATINIDMILDSFETVFAGEIMSRFADNGTDPS